MIFAQKENCVKAVLVIDMPKNCEWCPIRLSGEPNEWCWCLRHGLDNIKAKPSWCPLRPLPEKMLMRDEAEFYLGYMNGKTKYLGFNEGYNACLEDILGGE